MTWLVFPSRSSWNCCCGTMDETHLLYGSDVPYTDLSACFGQMEALENTQKLTEHQKQLMFTDNAKVLLPKLQNK